MPDLSNYKEFKLDYAGKELTVEIGKYAEQANGACLVRCGDTAVNVTVCMSETAREGMDFFPLSVDYEEKMFAVGKIPGGFKKREGRASDKAILVSRLIDRPIRPLFPKGIFNDVVVVATALSVDPDIAPEPLAMIGSSVALSISDIPWAGPTGSVIVGCIDGKYIINPTVEEKGAKIGYSLIANHAFVDGNKRIGIFVMLIFLEVNGVKIRPTNKEVVRVGLAVASGEMKYNELLYWILKNK